MIRVAMEVFPKKLRRIWSKSELRVSILISLSLQIILIVLGSYRKRNRAIWLSVILWLAYLSADSIAIFTLGHLYESQDSDSSSSHPFNRNNDLIGFWSPFLLLHLGGPDTITAYSLEDNELWRRHFLNLISQVILAVYAFIRSLSTTTLLAPTFLMFLAGVIKYGERTWALRYASRQHLKDTMLAPPAESPNYFKLVEKFYSFFNGGIPTRLEIEKFDPEPEPPLDDATQEEISDDSIIMEAHHFFNTYNRLIVDLNLTYKELRESQEFFFKRSAKQAFKVIEVELNLFFTTLYTKAALVNTLVGYIFRLISFTSILITLLLFLLSANKQGYERIDMIVTYIVLVGAIIIEMYAFMILVFSDTTVVQLNRLEWIRLWSIFKRPFFFFHPPGKARWCNSMGQYNLISHSIGSLSPTKTDTIMRIIRLKDMWDKYRYTSYMTVLAELKDFIFEQLKDNIVNCSNPRDYMRLYTNRGDSALQKLGYQNQLGWSVEAEFDESILIWHVATDLCFHAENPVPSEWNMCRYISDYMMYLLIQLPDMLTAGIADIRFKDTCDEIEYFIKEVEPKHVQVSDVLLQRHSVLDLPVVRDKNKSVLYKAGKLATELRGITVREVRWRIISNVWMEMLSYAAGHCRGFNHAKQLSSGGELLTHVWLLMAHLGIVEQYRIEEDNTKVKLTVQK